MVPSMKNRMPTKFQPGDIVSKKFNAFREKIYFLILAIKENPYHAHKVKYIFLVLDSNSPYYVAGQQREDDCEHIDRGYEKEV